MYSPPQTDLILTESTRDSFRMVVLVSDSLRPSLHPAFTESSPSTFSLRPSAFNFERGQWYRSFAKIHPGMNISRDTVMVRSKTLIGCPCLTKNTLRISYSTEIVAVKCIEWQWGCRIDICSVWICHQCTVQNVLVLRNHSLTNYLTIFL